MGAASLQAASLFDELSLEEKRVWQRLLHFRGGDSLIDETTFFTSPEGIENAAKELEAFVTAVKENKTKHGRFNLPIACAFPARVEFLLKSGLIQEAPDQGKCIPWKKWQKEIAPDAISIIFSTSYPNNPGSMFGHTFLRFHKKGQVNDLLDYGANFSALVDPTDWGPVYALKGMFGGYPGFFDLSPYYEKVNEYNHSENRDLIEYELNLTSEEVRFILAHLWELYNGAFFDYYFVSENCSFHLADLISLVHELPVPRRWFYLPADLIWVLNEKPELVRSIVQRPSLKKKTLERVEVLNEDQLERVKKVKNGERLDTLGASIDEWDALIEWLNFEKYEFKGNVSEQQKELLYLALKKRATLKRKSNDLPEPNLLNRPELGHKAQRFSLGIGQLEDEEYLRLEYRSGFHDLMAFDLGFDPWSEFQFLKGSLLYLKDRQKIKADNLSLVEIVSLDPWTKISRTLSWKVGAKLDRMNEYESCRLCKRTRVFGKLGISLGNRGYIFALFGGGAINYSAHLRDHFQVSTNVEMFGAYAFEKGKIMLGIDSFFNVDGLMDDYYQKVYFKSNLFLSRNQEIRFEASKFFQGNHFDDVTHNVSLEWGIYF